MSRLRHAASVTGTLVLVATVALVTVLAAPGVVGAESSFVVLSGSMEPEIGAGDMVVVESAPAESIEEGEVITFRSDEVGGERTDRVTHRVIEVRETDDGPVFRTKGDANDAPDPEPVEPEQVVGVVWFTVPAIGRAVLAAQRPVVQGALIAGPGVLLMAGGLRTLFAGAASDDS